MVIRFLLSKTGKSPNLTIQRQTLPQSAYALIPFLISLSDVKKGGKDYGSDSNTKVGT